jgi:hypothetical protein
MANSFAQESWRRGDLNKVLTVSCTGYCLGPLREKHVVIPDEHKGPHPIQPEDIFLKHMRESLPNRAILLKAAPAGLDTQGALMAASGFFAFISSGLGTV